MSSNLTRGALLFLLLILIQGVSGQQISTDSLSEKVIENRVLFHESPEKALYNITESNGLLAEAIESNNHDIELNLLSNLCEYYFLLKMDFKETLSRAKALQAKSIEYDSQLFLAKSHKYMAQAYLINGLYSEFFNEIDQGLKIISKQPSNDLFLMEEANFYTTRSNYYLNRHDLSSAIGEIQKSARVHNRLVDVEKRRGTKFMDYTNLGAVYLGENLDSASYYAKRAIDLSLEKEYNHNLMFVNYVTLGSVYQKQEDFGEALSYYVKAEKIKDGKHFMNVRGLYRKIVSIHQALGDTAAQREYEYKIKDIQVEITENKNESLTDIVNDKNEKIQSWVNRFIWVVGIVVLIFILLGVGVFVYKQKRKQKPIELVSPKEMTHFISLAQKNDTSFLIAFEEKFTNFSRRLLRINSELTVDDIELLAMLKLEFTSKQIASFKDLQHRTVQNRRYKVRTKLNLPSSTNLYKWVEEVSRD